MTGYCDPKLDKLMTQSDQALDFATRKPLMDQVQDLLADDALDLPIYFNTSTCSSQRQAAELQGQRHQPGQLLERIRVGSG